MGGGGDRGYTAVVVAYENLKKKKDKTVIKNVTVSAKGVMAYESVSP